MDDQEFLKAFEDCSLPFDQWTHRAHVKVAFLSLRQFPFDQALDKLREGIKRFNAANQVVESPNSGYNETTTHAFLRLVASAMHAYNEAIPTPTSDAFCDAHPQLLCKHVLRIFYSPEARMNPLSKMEFVEPDLVPLPSVLIDSASNACVQRVQ